MVESCHSLLYQLFDRLKMAKRFLDINRPRNSHSYFSEINEMFSTVQF